MPDSHQAGVFGLIHSSRKFALHNFFVFIADWPRRKNQKNKRNKTMQMTPRLKAMLLSGSALLFAASVVQAQMGSGWTQQSYSERLEYHHTGGDDLDTISPAPSSGFADSWIAYTNKNSTRYFWFKNTDAGRVEIRVNN